MEIGYQAFKDRKRCCLKRHRRQAAKSHFLLLALPAEEECLALRLVMIDHKVQAGAVGVAPLTYERLQRPGIELIRLKSHSPPYR